MSKVVMTHPELPGREVEVHEAALRHHERAGWRRKSTQTEPVDLDESATDAPEITEE